MPPLLKEKSAIMAFDICALSDVLFPREWGEYVTAAAATFECGVALHRAHAAMVLVCEEERIAIRSLALAEKQLRLILADTRWPDGRWVEDIALWERVRREKEGDVQRAVSAWGVTRQEQWAAADALAHADALEFRALMGVADLGIEEADHPDHADHEPGERKPKTTWGDFSRWYGRMESHAVHARDLPGLRERRRNQQESERDRAFAVSADEDPPGRAGHAN